MKYAILSMSAWVSRGPVATAQDATNILLTLARQIGVSKICSLDDITRKNGMVAPANSTERLHLYLRCEAKGGADEFTQNSCCDHLTKDDAEQYGVCPDNMITPTIKELYRAQVQCSTARISIARQRKEPHVRGR